MNITIVAKVNDMCNVIFDDAHNYIEHDGYVPNYLGFGGGDYIELTIDNETGQITGWKPLSWEQIRGALEI